MSQKSKRAADKGLVLAKVSPLTFNQRETVTAWNEGANLFLCGSAGTGKTFLALHLALKELTKNDSKQDRILIFRSTVPQRDVGFLPGSLKEKIAQYEHPYERIVAELYNRGDAYGILKSKGILEFHSTSFNRGLTLENSIIIVDECQNMNFEELSTAITRSGKNTRIIYCGDDQQNDLIRNRYDVSGFDRFLDIIDEMESFDVIEFEVEDVVRSGIVKEFLRAQQRVLRAA